MATYGRKCVGHGSQTVTSAAALGLAYTGHPIPPTAQTAAVYVSEDCRTWEDGTEPTTTTGMPIDGGATFTLESRHAIDNFKCIAASTSAEMTYEFFDM